MDPSSLISIYLENNTVAADDRFKEEAQDSVQR